MMARIPSATASRPHCERTSGACGCPCEAAPRRRGPTRVPAPVPLCEQESVARRQLRNSRCEVRTVDARLAGCRIGENLVAALSLQRADLAREILRDRADTR